MEILRRIAEGKLLFFDGAMGTVLQQQATEDCHIPAILNKTEPKAVYEVHRAYLDAGADFITTNTFSINDQKLLGTGFNTAELVTAGVKLARQAIDDSGKTAYLVLDIGPLGQMLAPTGTLAFDDAYNLFKTQVIAGYEAGCDAVLIETIADLYEAKAAILAIKENSDLPIFCTMTYVEEGRTFMGTDPQSMVTVLEGLGVTALGVNCSTGPQDMIPLVREIRQYTSLPILVQPNAGLPLLKDGHTFFDMTPLDYAEWAKELVLAGVSILGGCCGTTPEFIRECVQKLQGTDRATISEKKRTAIASYAKTVYIGEGVTLIGERINPTGKKWLKKALRSGDDTAIVREALAQVEEGADVLDVNLGLPDINEAEAMQRIINKIQSVSEIPLQIDSSRPAIFERAARYYNGKPLLNSVNGKPSSMAAVFPIAKHYGACVLALTLDENGIPPTAEGRLAIATKIIATAETYGIPAHDIIIDCLTLTASAQQAEVQETLRAVQLVKSNLGVKTALGVSNVSFGLPNRPLLNRTFLAMALQAGLDAPIMNTNDAGMMDAVRSYRVLANDDQQANAYITAYRDRPEQPLATPKDNSKAPSLQEIITKGLMGLVEDATKQVLAQQEPFAVIEAIMIPTLDQVGRNYEQGITFLPQLIQSAEVAKKAFTLINEKLLERSPGTEQKPQIALATVAGDIHDIGKDIVGILLENYGFKVIDLGRDVSAQSILDCVEKHDIRLVGLSALMTSTVQSMAETIELLNQNQPECRIMVGGAVMNPEYAKMIKADFYGSDARAAVAIAREHLLSL